MHDQVVVRTSCGPVRGLRTARGEAYLGVPYAAPPVGPLRWRPPTSPAPWTAELDCVEPGPMCPQLDLPDNGSPLLCLTSRGPMDEDCLSLNVWTPAADDAKRPTMVWIHGGGFMGGGSAMPVANGSAFARDGVVLVSINYRLGPFGFLYLDGVFDGAQGTGNLGVLDQVKALEWVRDNIASFGGDPDNVTVFGQSAGAISIATLLATPAAEGLFQKAILQSGAGHHNLGVEAASRVTARFLELIDVEAGDWSSLQLVPTDALVAAAAQIGQLEAATLLGPEADKLMAFAPVVDGVHRSELPIDLIRAGAGASVDLLVGTTADEMNVAVWGLPEEILEHIPEPDIEAYFGHRLSATEILSVYEGVRPERSRRHTVTAVWTDQFCTIPTLRLAEAQAAAGGCVRLYRFTWGTEIGDGNLGACHGIDIPFVFDNVPVASALLGDGPPAGLATAVHGAWVRFAATGDPSGPDIGAWPRYANDDRSVMVFERESRVVADPTRTVRELWAGTL